MENNSEVARILAQITQEYEAATRGLTGIAITAQHSFIDAKMKSINNLRIELEKCVGDKAIELIAMRMNQSDETHAN